MEKYDDEPDLVARSREGDLAAFNALVERYQRPLYNLCLRMLASPEAAEDATQEAFIHSFRSIHTFRGGSLKSWLFRIAANACYDEMRRRRARPAVSLDEPHGADERRLDVRDSGPAPQERAEHRELAEALQDALTRLPPDQRLAIVLADVHGLDYSEVAEITACSLGTVKSRISRGRRQLRLILRERGELLPSHLRQVSEGQNDVVA
ncbi:MAG TPA: sigma-70 family RNA polymerase sigma factor [Dehalococcoidia bacterium]|nr:sigma-70 family RNA polymerase sigma factor [Dehalococcoidia bacterium]